MTGADRMTAYIESYYLQDDCVCLMEFAQDGSVVVVRTNELNCRVLGLPYPDCVGRPIGEFLA